MNKAVRQSEPEPARHEGAITEPLDEQPLPEPARSEDERRHAAPATRADQESEPHEGAITEPEAGGPRPPPRS